MFVCVVNRYFDKYELIALYFAHSGILKKPYIKVCLNPNSKLGRKLQEKYESWAPNTQQIIHQTVIKKLFKKCPGFLLW